MQVSPLPVRTHSSFESDETFQQLMAERLRQAPWLVLSAALHGVLLLLIWVFVPAEQPKAQAARVDIDLTETQPEVVKPPPEKPPETQPEIDPEVVVTKDVVVANNEAEAFDNVDADNPTKESAFPFDQWNAATGLGGGAAGPYGNRGGGGKPGGRQSPVHVQRGLEWLAKHQDADGRWDADGFMKHDDNAFAICGGPGNAVHDIGVTGLALLAFLGENNTLRQGQYRDVVKRGVNWLRGQQQQNGLFGSNTSHDFVYDHAVAAYAMCEAYGLSDSRLLQQPAQLGLNYLESHRNPYSVWRYQPADGDSDLSVTAWCVMAYESGRYFGLTVSDAALQLAATFLDEVSDPSGLHGYTHAGQRSSRRKGEHEARFPADKGHALTAVGLFCRFFLGQDPSEKPIMQAAARLLLQLPPVWNEQDGSVDHYYWYYATYALFQMGGQPWKAWQKQLDKAVGEHQHQERKDPNLFGSWDPVGAWGEDGGRVYSTAILTLTMQANYRYTRLIR